MRKVFSLKNDVFPLVHLAIPLALTGMIQSAIWFFETLFLARLGAPTLAAGSLVSWLFGTVAVILFGTLSSINILVAHKHGANDQQGIALVARDGLLLAMLLVIPSFVLFWNMSEIFLWFGQPPSIVILASSYLHALAWGLPANFLMIACLEVMMGIGHARQILVYTIVSVSLDIFFSYAFIFGKFGFAAYGIAGAGWGLTVGCWITAAMLLAYVIFDKTYRKVFRYVLSFHKPTYLLELLLTGLPMGAMYCVEVAFFFALTLVMGLLGSQMQAANQVALQYLGLLMAMMFSIAQAITVRMGHLLGAKEKYAAVKAAYTGIGLAILLASVAAVVYWLCPEILIAADFDLHNPSNFEIIRDIKQLLLIAAIFQIVEGTRIALFGALRGVKDTKITLVTSLISFWVIALPVGYWLAIYMNLNGPGFWWGMVMGASVSVVLLIWRFQVRLHRYSNHM